MSRCPLHHHHDGMVEHLGDNEIHQFRAGGMGPHEITS
jgi:hypothetical protein